MITVDTKELRRLESELKVFARRAYPFATKATINSAAFSAQRTARKGIKQKFTTRNRFTEQSVRVEQAKTLNVSRQSALVGSTADYMVDQEFGGTKVKKGKKGVAIPTSYSAGQGENKQPRTRLPRKANKLQNIVLKRRRKRGASRAQQNLIAVKQAAASNRKYVYLDLKRREGIFKIIGGKNKPRIKMVHDLSRKSVRIPRSPWLGPAVTKTVPKIPEMYVKALRFQLQRNNLFR